MRFTTMTDAIECLADIARHGIHNSKKYGWGDPEKTMDEFMTVWGREIKARARALVKEELESALKELDCG